METQAASASRLKRLVRWLDQRTALNQILKVSLDEPIPGGARWAYVFGSGLLFIFISQVITGLCLAIYYVPSAQNAHVSVAYITKQVAAGDFLRSLHYYGSSAMVIVLMLHFLQTFLFGAYKGRRELLWISGCTLSLLVLGMAFTGYLLPWDQKAYFATAVGTNIVSQIPFIGSWMARIMRGGDTLGTLTLSRFYIAHVMLIPGCIFGIIGTHIYLFRQAGAAGPVSESPVEPKLPPESFYPKQVLMDMAFASLIMAVLGFLALTHPVELGPRANPAASNFLPRPEWYYLPFFEWLKFWEGPGTLFGAVIFPAVLALLFFGLPFLDRKLERRPWRRPIPLLAVSIVLLGMIYLGLLSHYQDMHEPTVRRQLELQAAQEKAYAESPFQPFMQAPGAINLLQPASTNPMVARGKALFSQNGCSGCHGPRGRGAIGPSLVGIGKKFNPDALVALLNHPSPAMTAAGMPAPDLPNNELKELVSYLDALGTPAENVEPEMTALLVSNETPAPAITTSQPTATPAVPVSTAPASQDALITQGRQVFQAHACFACHGPMAQGTRHAPALAGWAARTPATVIQTHITNPTPAMRAKGMMPVPLPQDQLNAVTAFLKSLPAPPAKNPPGFTSASPVAQHGQAQTSSSAAALVANSAPPPTATPASGENIVAAGHAVYTAHTCATCHGPAAQGTTIAPPLAGLWQQISEPTFNTLIHNPTPAMRAKGMPPATTSEAETRQLWAFLKSLPVPAKLAKVAPTMAAENAAPARSEPAPAAPPATAPAPIPQSSASSTAAAPPQSNPKAAASLAGPAAIGEQIFQSHGCIACHGANGVGTPLAVPLIGVTQKYSPAQLANLIRHPNPKMKAGGMPTLVFSDGEMNDLVSYLATLKQQAPPAAASATAAVPVHNAPPHKLTAEEEAGKRIYSRIRCASCHGSGGMEGTAAAPSLTATASELPPEILKKLLQHPSQVMQAKGMPPVDLNDSDLNALVAYIRSLRHNR